MPRSPEAACYTLTPSMLAHLRDACPRCFWLLGLDPVRLHRFAAGEQALVALRPTWIEIDRRDAAFERFLAEVVQRLARDDPPPGTPHCPCCRYHARRRERDPIYHHDGLPF